MPLYSSLVYGIGFGTAAYLVETIEFIVYGPIKYAGDDTLSGDIAYRFFMAKYRNVACCAIVAAILMY
jgi:hypothetical protein